MTMSVTPLYTKVYCTKWGAICLLSTVGHIRGKDGVTGFYSVACARRVTKIYLEDKLDRFDPSSDGFRGVGSVTPLVMK